MGKQQRDAARTAEELADKPLLSDDEVAAMQSRAAEVFGPEADAVFGDSLYLALLDDTRSRQTFVTGTYSQNWVPDRYFENRTSLIEDPPDGKLPPLTQQAIERRAAAAAARPPRANGPADFSLPDRCITYGIPDLFAAYMSVYRIFQTDDHVVIQMEKIHDARVIPLDGRPPLAPRFVTISATRAAGGTATRSWSRPRTSIRPARRWAATFGSPMRTCA